MSRRMMAEAGADAAAQDGRGRRRRRNPVERLIDKARDPIRGLNDLQIRRSGAVVVSFPKSGRTWLRKQLIDLKITLPFTHAHADAIVKGLPPRPPEPGEFADRKVVLMVRDPRDVATSFYQDVTRRYGVYDGSLSEMLRHPDIGLDAIARFNLTWIAAAPRLRGFHLLRYEALKADGEAEMLRLMAFLGLPWIGVRRIRATLEASSFERMRAQEETGALAAAYDPRWFSRPETGDAYRKVRRGRAGGFVEDMDAEDLAYCREVLERAGYPAGLLAAPA